MRRQAAVWVCSADLGLPRLRGSPAQFACIPRVFGCSSEGRLPAAGEAHEVQESNKTRAGSQVPQGPLGARDTPMVVWPFLFQALQLALSVELLTGACRLCRSWNRVSTA